MRSAEVDNPGPRFTSSGLVGDEQSPGPGFTFCEAHLRQSPATEASIPSSERYTTAVLRLDQTLEVVPEKLVAGGDSLSRVEGMPLFVRSIFPGDRALVRVTEAKKGYARGELVELLDAGPLRRYSPCPVADECGGCDWTALRLDAQLRAKKEILVETLRRIGKIDPETLPELGVHPSPLNYRIRSRLHVDRKREAVGFFALRSNHVVDLPPECEVVGPQTIENLAAIKRETLSSGAPEVALFEERDELAVEPFDGEPEGHETTIEIAGFRYHLSTAGFFQVNRHLLATLIRRVEELASRCSERRSALDLYGGVGFFALPLARLFEKVNTVEGSAAAHRFAKKNGRRAGNIHAVRMPVEKYLAENRRASFVMLDPPRAGVAPGVMEMIDATGASMICHLSCDPVTFARDAARLLRRGWQLSTLELVDLFPNTHHIETLASFVRSR
jgi:23S rRNA (uracil1939-C5)-methyltransferase